MRITKEALELNLKEYNLTIAEIEKYAEQLPGREKQIIFMRFGLLGEPMTIEKIGFKFGFSGARSHELVHRILGDIRDMKEKNEKL